jgi:hypothetical protein
MRTHPVYIGAANTARFRVFYPSGSGFPARPFVEMWKTRNQDSESHLMRRIESNAILSAYIWQESLHLSLSNVFAAEPFAASKTRPAATRASATPAEISDGPRRSGSPMLNGLRCTPSRLRGCPRGGRRSPPCRSGVSALGETALRRNPCQRCGEQPLSPRAIGAKVMHRACRQNRSHGTLCLLPGLLHAGGEGFRCDLRSSGHVRVQHLP